MAVAALLATASSVTATLYASAGMSAGLADAGLFPQVFGKASRLGRHGGLLISAALSTLFVTVLGLGTLAAVGSAVSLAVFWLVAIAAFNHREELRAKTLPVVVAIAIATVVLVGFIIDLARNDPRSLASAILLFALALIGQFAMEMARRGPSDGTRTT